MHDFSRFCLRADIKLNRRICFPCESRTFSFSKISDRSDFESFSIDGDFEPRRMYLRLQFVACSVWSEWLFLRLGRSHLKFAKDTAFLGRLCLLVQAMEDRRGVVAVMVPKWKQTKRNTLSKSKKNRLHKMCELQEKPINKA